MCDYGRNIQGTWTLRVTDNVKNNKTGTLNSWTLTALHDAPQSLRAPKAGATGNLIDDELVRFRAEAEAEGLMGIEEKPSTTKE